MNQPITNWLGWAIQLASDKYHEELKGITDTDVAREFNRALQQYPVLMQKAIRQVTQGNQ